MTKKDKTKKKRPTVSMIGHKDDSKDNQDQIVPYYKLFQYSTAWDKVLIFLAAISAVTAGICMPIMFFLFGKAAGFLVDYDYAVESGGANPKVLEEAGQTLYHNMIWFAWFSSTLGIILFVSTYITTVLLNYTALKQTFRIRHLFFASVLNQDISWFDQNKTGNFSSRMVDDLKKLEEGLGEKFGMIIYYQSICLASLIQGLIQGWEFALICMVTVPVTMIAMGIVSWISSKYSKQEIEAYAQAGSVAEEVLSSIKTVVAFGGQTKEEARYNSCLESAKNNNIKRAIFNGISMGVTWFFAYCSFAFAFWYGVKLVIKERNYLPDERTYNPSNMITVFMSVFCAQVHLGLASPFIETIGIAKGAATKIFSIISSQPVINQSKERGQTLERVEGKISFKDVYFSYPSRKEVEVLSGFNLTINPGETVALVGSSGCGKSTCVQLIQRFYDADSGSIFIDNENIKDLDLDCLRSYIGVVGQEPVLFETTIAENIRYGLSDATQEEIETAAKKANAHTFISAFPQGYSTVIGERGAQLSGGQKQRIAIARALVREPAILLLDEATSALDTNSESIVQDALDQASCGCTTVIVAHRLSTVRKADRIFVMSHGQMQEEGSHDDLMKSKGEYYRLVLSQVTDSEGSDAKQPTGELNSPVDIVEDIQQDGLKDKHISFAESCVKKDKTKKLRAHSPLWSIVKYNSPEWPLIILGCFCCMINGAGVPLYAIIFGNVIGVLSGQDVEEIQTQMNLYSISFIVIAVGISVATMVQFYSLGVAGENLTLRLRSLMFKAMLLQEIGWFDDQKNGVGSLCARLSGEPESVQGATGQRIGTLLNTGTTVIMAVTVSFYYEWKVTLVALCFSPLLVIASYMEQKILVNESHDYYQALENSSKIAVEALSGIRTVVSVGCEYIFHDLYMKELQPYISAAKRNTHFRSIVYGIARSLQFFAYAAVLYYGATLVINERLETSNVIIVCESLLVGAWSLANTLAFAPNFSKGLFGAERIFQLIHRTPKVLDGSQNPEGLDAGSLSYRNVCFSYPNRPTVEVLTNLNLSVLKGKTVALVGPSGCGKSTIVQLLERFYDPTSGGITADATDINELKLHRLRFQFGMVSQEPNLFSKTIAENIAYGDNGRTVTMEEIIDAAKQANIHNFITSLPLGYQTELGEKGTQLSGGQKQRVAIARALVRNPKVLLLDEATSALDAESEKVVQEALDNARVGRTCITIAHRLTTIQTADVICVVNQGKISEMGTHSDLLSRKGLYYNLHSLQDSKLD